MTKSQSQQLLLSHQQEAPSPASAALDQLLNYKPTPIINENKPMITASSCMKRSRSSATLSSSFDMSVFQEVSQQVEESIAFPSIEWSFDDHTTEEEQDDDDLIYQSPNKRRCINGLTRSSQASFDLSTTFSSRSNHKRSGSNGSLC